MSQAFQPPSLPLLPRCTGPSRKSAPRRYRLASTRPRACVQRPPENDDNRGEAFQIKTSRNERENGPERPALTEIHDETEATFRELDQLAEEWIGADLSRWEWYERMKSRRQKLVDAVRKSEEELDQEFEELRRTFMEFDAVFGTRMLDDESSISPAGWGTVAFVLLSTVGVAYWIFDLVVRAAMDVAPAFPF